jgi:hypothetical protein
MPILNIECIQKQTTTLLNIVLLLLTNTMYCMFNTNNHKIKDDNFNQRICFINLDIYILTKYVT